MNAHKTILKHDIGNDGLEVRVWEHCDREGIAILTISRHGVDTISMTPDELVELGSQLTVAGQLMGSSLNTQIAQLQEARS